MQAGQGSRLFGRGRGQGWEVEYEWMRPLSIASLDVSWWLCWSYLLRIDRVHICLPTVSTMARILGSSLIRKISDRLLLFFQACTLSSCKRNNDEDKIRTCWKAARKKAFSLGSAELRCRALPDHGNLVSCRVHFQYSHNVLNTSKSGVICISSWLPLITGYKPIRLTLADNTFRGEAYFWVSCHSIKLRNARKALAIGLREFSLVPVLSEY